MNHHRHAKSFEATATNASLTSIPISLLDSFLPGYSIISRFLLESAGFDVSILVSSAFLLVAIATALRYIYDQGYRLLQDWLMSSITVSSDDQIFEQVLRWLEKRKLVDHSRYMRVKSRNTDNEEDEDFEPTQDEKGTTKFFNYGEWEARSSPRFEPHLGKHNFWWKGNYYTFQREPKKDQVEVRFVRGNRAGDDRETIKLTCFGRSTEPIKALLQDAKILYLSQQKTRTTVRAAAGGRHWEKVSSRPSRPMTTVCLDDALKTALLEDVNRFLYPASQKWYANRGIPYRRGYLFHGPPGTGKTSTAFALAGVFGLEIHFISLMDSSMTEENLTALFKSLPRRCVVLLEDIDTAMVNRKDDIKVRESGEASRGGRGKRRNEDGEAENGVSLSGLLNAIDGVASQEGRVLIMTTNYKDELDDALIRPGRVDMQIFFGLATRSQISEIFVRMYHTGSDEDENDGLEELSVRFANALPEEEFTPAEVQGYLLTRRTDKGKALEDAEAWCVKMREDRSKKDMEEREREEQRREKKEKERLEKEEKEKADEEKKEKDIVETEQIKEKGEVEGDEVQRTNEKKGDKDEKKGWRRSKRRE